MDVMFFEANTLFAIEITVQRSTPIIIVLGIITGSVTKIGSNKVTDAKLPPRLYKLLRSQLP
jgi:hypothetical protein